MQLSRKTIRKIGNYGTFPRKIPPAPPYHSANARVILDQAQRLRLPVVMTTGTSAELQRTEARKTNR